MADELSSFLTSSRPRARLSPERLELMGKEAATLLIDKGIPLNESITKLAGEYPDVNAEQVKRIVEFANQSAYLALHDKNKTAGAEASYPQFELADANRVLGDLSDGARPTRVTDTDIAYSRLPEKPKISTAKLEAEFEEMFVGDKRAQVLDFSTDTVVDHIMSTKEHLVALRQSLESSAEQLDLMSKDAHAELYDMTKRHILEGGSLADIIKVAHSSGVPSDQAAVVLQPVVVNLLKEKVASPEDLKQQVSDYVKIAHREIDESHPLVTTFRASADLNSEIVKVAIALTEVDASLERVNKAIKEEFFADR